MTTTFSISLSRIMRLIPTKAFSKTRSSFLSASKWLFSVFFLTAVMIDPRLANKFYRPRAWYTDARISSFRKVCAGTEGEITKRWISMMSGVIPIEPPRKGVLL